MKRSIPEKRRRFFNLSLTVKMFLLFSCACLAAMGAAFFISYRQLYVSTRVNQEYLAHQRFEQTQAMLEERLERVESITRMAIGNENLNLCMKQLMESNGFSDQYVQVQSAWEWIKNIYYGTDYDSVVLYLDGEYPFADGISGYVRDWDSEEGRQIWRIMEQNGYSPFWQTVNMEKNGEEGCYLIFVRPVTNLEDFSRNLGSMHVYIHGDKLAESFLNTPQEEVYYIKSGDGKLLTVSDRSLYDKIAPDAELENACSPEGGKVRSGGREYYARMSEIGESGLLLYAVMPSDTIRGVFRKTGLFTAFLFIADCAVLLLAIWLISRSVSSRIRHLSKTVQKVQDGKLETLDEEAGQDEVGQLIGNYNYMIRRIRKLLEEQYQLGQEKKEAELMALQSQITPHFLYNTLDMINWMASKNETENIRDTVLSLARYYKLILNKGRDIITIGLEIELCEAYIAIQQKRYRGKILFELDVEEQIRDCLIPKITLQPLIENAITHGIMEKSSGRGNILISGWEEDDDIFLSVTDDGVGMITGQEMEQKHKGSKYGLSNIETRLKLFYNMEKCITFESTQGIGTCVSIRVRKIKEKDIQEKAGREES
ncbi:sensor histidine kinase [Eisenbergiella tayi]|uniref:sensor histidine kinase n=1 Tax=Eisenbergiella tayi TaxID=1432052 RepID=UPI0034C334DF